MDNMNCKLQLRICENLEKYSVYEDMLYQIFLLLYEKGTLHYKENLVHMKHYPPDYGPKTGFYHMICENYQHTGNEEDRKPNLRRCERLEWAKQFIEKCSQSCEKLMVWENQRHGKKNILLFCPDLNYLVVLSKRRDYYLLTTAYPVDYPNKRKDLIKEYNAYISKQRTSV